MKTVLLSICLEHGRMIEEILGLLKEKDKKGQKITENLPYLEVSKRIN